MKRLAILMFALLLVVSAQASAQSGGDRTLIQATLTRNISLKTGLPENPVIPGESPVTGLPISEQKYIPILVQIDNNLAAIPQWGIADADIMYELPIQGGGWTRLTALFSDKYPAEAGPVRSARVMHADLREGWDALLVNYGRQEERGSDLREALKNYGVNQKGLAIDGIYQQYEKYMPRVRYHMAPHNVSAYVTQLHDLMVQQGYDFPEKPFRFSDEPRLDGQAAKTITIVHKQNADTKSTFIYDEYEKGYQRYIVDGAYLDLLKPEQHLTYANVIVQRTRLDYNRSSLNPILPDIISGSGAADIFIGGRYIAGAWSRANAQARTVFHDETGEEIKLNRGKTWIVVADIDTDVSYEGEANPGDYLPAGQAGAAVPGAVADNQATAANPGNTVTEESPAQPVENAGQAETAPQADKQNAAPAEEASAQSAVVQTKNKGPLNMRKADKGSSDIIARIPNESLVKVISRGDEWCKVEYENKTGFVMTSYLTFGN